MNKLAIRLSFPVVLAVALAPFVSLSSDSAILQTFYSVVGVMFSIAMGLIITVDLNGIKNKGYIGTIRKNLRDVQSSFIIFFSISTGLYIIQDFLKGVVFKFSFFDYVNYDLYTLIAWISLFCMIFSIVYFVFNFIAIKTLRDDITDTLNED